MALSANPTNAEIVADLRRRLTGNGDFNPNTVFPLFKLCAERLEAMPSTMIDDMSGLFSHASDAHRAGVRAGRQEMYDATMPTLARIGVEQEKDMSEFGTRGFHVAQACCKALRELKEKFDAQKQKII